MADKHPSYNLYTPLKGEKVYAYPTYVFEKYDTQNRPIYKIDITGFNNWHAVLGWKYMGKNEYDKYFPTNKKPGYDPNIGFQANDWNGIYYVSGKSTPDYPLSLINSGDEISIENLYEENIRDNLAGVFEDFYNCPYYKDLKNYIGRGKEACEQLTKNNYLIAANTEIEKKEDNSTIDVSFIEKPVEEETSEELLRDILAAIAVIDDNIVFNFVQKQDLNI